MRVVTTHDDPLGQWLSREVVQPYVTHAERVYTAPRKRRKAPTQDRIAAIVEREGAATVEMLMGSLGKTRSAVSAALSKLVEMGRVERIKPGVFGAVEA